MSYSFDSPMSLTLPRRKPFDIAISRRVKLFILALLVIFLFGPFILPEDHSDDDSRLFSLTRIKHGTQSGERGVWPGYAGVENLFVFGDSWTSTYFDCMKEQPWDANPLGNPDWEPAKGSKWPYYLTNDYNDSQIFTYNFAQNGAAIDRRIQQSETPDFVHQLRDDFLPNYAHQEEEEPVWLANNTLFITSFGINDNHATERWDGRETLHNDQIRRYFEQLDILYASGARNFLIINVPAVGRSPAGSRLLSSSILSWNSRLHVMVESFERSRPGSTVMQFDMFNFLNAVLDDPLRFPETSELQVITAPCDIYANNNWDLDVTNGACDYTVAEYLWHDGLHPTPPLQQALANQLAEFLRGENDEFDVRARIAVAAKIEEGKVGFATKVGKVFGFHTHRSRFGQNKDEESVV